MINNEQEILSSLMKINDEIKELNIKEEKNNDDYDKLTKLYFNQLLKGIQLQTYKNNFLN